MRKSLLLFLFLIASAYVHTAFAQGWTVDFIVDLQTADCYLEDMNSLSCGGVTGTPSTSSELHLGYVTVSGTTSSTTESFSFSASGKSFCPPPAFGETSVDASRTITLNTTSTGCPSSQYHSPPAIPSGSSTLAIESIYYPRIVVTTAIADCEIFLNATCSNGVGYTWAVSETFNGTYYGIPGASGSQPKLTPAQLQNAAFTTGPYNCRRWIKATGKTGTTSLVKFIDIPPPPPSLNTASSVGLNPECPDGEGKIRIVHNGAYSGPALSSYDYTVISLIDSTSTGCPAPPVGAPSASPPRGYCYYQKGNYQDFAKNSSIDLISGATGFNLLLLENKYVVKVGGTTTTSVNTCTVLETVDIIDPLPVTISSIFSESAPSCTGGNDGSRTFNLNNGKADFNWYIYKSPDFTAAIDQGTVSGSSFTSSGKFANGAGYRVLVDDYCTTVTNGPTQDFTFSTAGAGPLGLQTSTTAGQNQTSITCYDASGKGDAFWTVNPISPKPAAASPYTYKLYKGSSVSAGNYVEDGSSTGLNNKFTQLGLTTYTVHVTAPNGCVNTITKSDFSQPSALSGSFSVIDACAGSDNGKVIFTRTSSASNTLNFTLNGSAASATQVGNVWTISGLGSFSSKPVVVIDDCLSPNEPGLNASISDTRSIVRLGVLALNPDVNETNVTNNTTYKLSCFGDTRDVTVGYLNGRANYSVSVTKNSATYSASNYTHSQVNKKVTLNGLSAGTYLVSITDDCGNNVSVTFTITVPTQIIATSIITTNLTCNGNRSGKILVIASGGTPDTNAGVPNYVFKIYNDNTDLEVTTATKTMCPGNENCAQFSGLEENIPYRITATDVNNPQACTKDFNATSEVKTLTSPVLLRVNTITTADLTNDVYYNSEFYVQCKNDANISLNTQVTGGTPPYKWYFAKQNTAEWPLPFISQSSNIFPNLGSEVYKVYVGDINHCDSSAANFEIKQAAEPIQVNKISALKYAHGANTSCYDSLDGQIKVEVSGGVGNYTYSLTSNNGYNSTVVKPGVSHTFTDLPAINTMGDTITYTVAIQDALNCNWNGANGISNTIKLSPPDTVEFFWNVASRIVPGHEIPCHGDEASVIFTSEGGKYPHSITVGIVPMTIDSLGSAEFNLFAGTHTPVFTDALGCPAIAQNLSLIEPPTHVSIQFDSITYPICIGGKDGQIYISANDGIQFPSTGEEYLFLAKKLSTASFETDTLRGSAVMFLREADFYTSQDYILQVRDKHDCASQDTVTMQQNPTPLTLNSNTIVPPSCYGGNDGSISLTASNHFFIGGTSLKFKLSGGHLGNIIQEITVASDNHTFTGLAGTDLNSYLPYRAWVEDANACSDSAYQYLDNLSIISVPPVGVNVLEAIRPSCYNGSDGSLFLQISGGVPPYQYSNDNIAYQPVNVGNTIFLNNLLAGQHLVYIRDVQYKADQPACFSVFNFTVENGRFLRMLTESKPISCKGGNDGSIDLTTYVDNRPADENFDPQRLSLYWTHDNVSSLPISTLEDIGTLANGNYTVHTRYNVDSLICTNEKSVVVLEPSAIFTIREIKTYGASCGSFSDGRAIVSVSGGWPDSLSYYRIDNGSWGIFSGSSFILNALTPTEHTLEITQSEFACTDSENFTIESSKLFIAVSSVISPICPMGNDGAVVLASDSFTAEYAMEGENNYRSIGIFDDLPAGTYHFKARLSDNVSCVSDMTEAKIIDPADCGDGPLTLSLLGKVTATCELSPDGEAQVRATGGTPPYKLYWDGSTIAGADFKDNLLPGLHTITVKDAMNGLQAIDVTIEILPKLQVETFTDLASCPTSCDGNISVFCSNGSGQYTISWADANTDFNRINVCPGSYDFTVLDNRNSQCFSIGTIILDHFPELTISLEEAVPPVCPDGLDGYLSTEISGGSGSYQLAWSNGITNSKRIDGNRPGAYTLTVTDRILGCSTEKRLDLPDAVKITVESANVIAPLCHNGNDGNAELVLINVNSPLVRWESGQIGLKASGLITGPHAYSIKGSTGCITTGFVEIPDRPELKVDAFTTPVTCAGTCDGSLTLTTSGGATPYSISWLHGPRTAKLFGLCKGDYSYNVTDRNNCKVISTIEIISPAPIKVTELVKDPSCFGFNDGEISVSVQGGIAPYRYEWNTGSSLATITGLSDNEYSIDVKDANSCLITKTISLTQPAALQLLNVDIKNPSCNTSLDGKINFVASGGTTEYSFLWEDGDTKQAHSNLGTGKFNIVLLDAKGCSLARSFDLIAPLPLEIINVIQNNPKCYGELNGAVSIEVTGGTQPFTYKWNDGITSRDIELHKAGDYILTVTDKNKCKIDETFKLIDPPVPVINGISEEIVICTNSVAVAEPEGEWKQYKWEGPEELLLTTKRFESSVAGKYKLTAWDENGCPGEVAFKIEVSSNALIADFLRISEAVAFEPIVFVDISQPIPTSVEWLVPVSPDISVTSESISTLELIFTAPGKYEIGMRASMDNCISELYKLVEVAEPAAGRISTQNEDIKVEDELTITIYPNPASNHLELRIHSSSKDPIELRLLSGIGHRPVTYESVDGYFDYLIQWDITQAVAGVYYLLYQQNNIIKSKRVIVIR